MPLTEAVKVAATRARVLKECMFLLVNESGSREPALMLFEMSVNAMD